MAGRRPLIVLLDTTVVIDYLRGRASVVRRVEGLVDRGESVATSPVTVQEVVRGLRPNEVPDARGLFEGLVVLLIGEAEGWLAGEWQRDFASRGITLGHADCLIAATAHTAGAVLATANVKDFPMPELQIEHWPAG